MASERAGPPSGDGAAMSGPGTPVSPAEDLAAQIYHHNVGLLSGRPLATVIEAMYLATLVVADEIEDAAIHIELLRAIQEDCARRVDEIEAGRT